MEDFINAIKSHDLIACKKHFNSIMQDRVEAAIEDRKSEIVNSITVDGEERSQHEGDTDEIS